MFATTATHSYTEAAQAAVTLFQGHHVASVEVIRVGPYAGRWAVLVEGYATPHHLTLAETAATLPR